MDIEHVILSVKKIVNHLAIYNPLINRYAEDLCQDVLLMLIDKYQLDMPANYNLYKISKRCIIDILYKSRKYCSFQTGRLGIYHDEYSDLDSISVMNEAGKLSASDSRSLIVYPKDDFILISDMKTLLTPAPDITDKRYLTEYYSTLSLFINGYDQSEMSIIAGIKRASIAKRMSYIKRTIKSYLM